MKKEILIVGFGNIALEHYKNINKILPNSNISFLVHNNYQKKRINKNTKIFTKINDLKKYTFFLVIIATPASTHIEIAKKLLNKCQNFFIEKPISHKPENVKKFIDICNKKKIKLMIGYNMRYLSSLIKFREIIIKNKIGKILSIESKVGQYLPSWRKNKDYRKSVSAQKKLGGGVLLELSHEIDYLFWIFGKFSSLKAKISKESKLDLDVEDTATIKFFFHNNKINYLANLEMDFVRKKNIRFCKVFTSKGLLKWNGIQGKVTFYSKVNKKNNFLLKFGNQMKKSYFTELSKFIDDIKKMKYYKNNFDSLYILNIIESIRKSSKINKIINLKNL